MKSPVLKVNNVKVLPREDIGSNFCRVAGFHMDSKRIKRDKKFFRKDVVTITNQQNGRKVVRFIAGNGQNVIKSSDLGLDYDARDILGLASKEDRYNADIEVRLSTALEKFVAKWSNENPDVRGSFRWQVISIASTLVSLGLGVLSLWLAI